MCIYKEDIHRYKADVYIYIKKMQYIYMYINVYKCICI